jgi:non-heme chloroperoxidase
MKKYIFILVLLINVVVTAQPIKNFSTQKHTIQLSTGITMKYVEAGYDKGEVVILLHGYTDTGRSFFQTMDALTKLDPSLKIYALDQRGHGKSSMPAEHPCAQTPESCFSPTEFAKDVIAFMDQKNISKAYVVGHSMGSINAQELAFRFPDRLNGVVLIGSFVNGKEMPFIKDFLIEGILENLWRNELEKEGHFRWPTDAFNLRPFDLKPTLTDWIKTDWTVDPTAKDALIRAIYPETMQIKLGTWIGAIKALALVDNREALKNLKVPVLVLWATQDNACPESQQILLRESLDKAVRKNNITYTFKTYGREPLPESGLQENELGHNLQWGAPIQVAEDIYAFMTTGTAKVGLPYANPKNIQEVLVEENNVNIIQKRGH